MLTHVMSMQGIGLFHNTDPSPTLAKVAMFYAENGRGKSTLASVLRSCGDNDASSLTARQTLDSPRPQVVSFLYQDAAGVQHPIDLAAGTWSHPISDLQVFDADFIKANVYSGTVINTDHRSGLLEFALGEEAVSRRAAVDASTARLTEITRQITAQTAVVRAHAGSMLIDSFCKLPENAQAQDEIDQLERKIATAGLRDEILRKAVPELIALPSFDPGALFAILAKTIGDIDLAAERRVKEHVAKCAVSGLEHWISQGRSFEMDQGCPYCGTSVEGNVLVQAYRTYFNEEYKSLKADAARLERGIETRLADGIVDTAARSIDLARAVAQGWSPYLDTGTLDFDSDGMKDALIRLRNFLEPLAREKSQQPLERVGSDQQLTDALAMWESSIEFIRTANVLIDRARTDIAGYKKTLVEEDVPGLRRSVQQLKLSQVRHTPEVAADVERLNQLTAEKERLSTEKKIAREALDELMTNILSRYQGEINSLLDRFGTRVQIDAMGFDYRDSGRPRSDYRLKVRGRDVPLGASNGPSFGNTLSEGDKRALAFAFFTARLLQDPKLAERVVVIDDPMCSLDRSRRSATVRVLKELATKCRQLIVMAHDAFFLLQLDESLSEIPARLRPARSYCKITAAPNDYSTFCTLNLAEECAAEYDQDLTLVSAYADSQPGAKATEVATVIRRLLEASLQRQFSAFIPRGKSLGDVISDVEKSQPPSPLASLASSVPVLRDFNDYAKQFNHADDGSPPNLTRIDEGELRTYTKRILQFVLRG